MQGIYKITNIINNKCYIGKSKDIENRWQYHKDYKNNAREYNKPLYKAPRKYGVENFNFEIIEELSDYSISDEREKYWIKYYNSYGTDGYNATTGGEGGLIKKTSKLSEEDVINIRKIYAECELTAAEVYPQYKDKISKRGFQAVWTGQNWKDIMIEIYTQENKYKHTLLNRKREGKIRKGEIDNE